MDELIFGFSTSDYGRSPIDPESFYTSEESVVIMPDYDTGSSPVIPRDPKPLKEVLTKLHAHLRDNHEAMPIDYFIENTNHYSIYTGTRLISIQGFHNEAEHRDELLLIETESGKRSWVKAEPEIVIEGERLRVHGVNKLDRFGPALVAAIHMCEQAIEEGRMVRWSFDN